MNRVLSAIDKGRRTAWALSMVTFMLVVLGMTASGAPPILPDPQLTPGATLEVTSSDICVPGYTKKVRAVPAADKQQVYAAYGIRDHAPGAYEIDHLIPLELGGSNAVKNLWPQSFQTQPWNAHVKDHLENELHRSEGLRDAARCSKAGGGGNRGVVSIGYPTPTRILS